jgi:hypothetical protein
MVPGRVIYEAGEITGAAYSDATNVIAKAKAMGDLSLLGELTSIITKLGKHAHHLPSRSRRTLLTSIRILWEQSMLKSSAIAATILLLGHLALFSSST